MLGAAFPIQPLPESPLAEGLRAGELVAGSSLAKPHQRGRKCHERHARPPCPGWKQLPGEFC